jgi:integrase
MSIERIERDSGVVWRVRWRESGRNRSKVLGRKRDAEAFAAELRRRKRTGEIALLDAGKETLAAFGEDWWQLYAEPNLAATTLTTYATMWDAYVLPHLGSHPLRDLTPTVINRFRLELDAQGVGRMSIAKTMTLLQGVLQRACEWERLASNPVRAVRKPRPAPRRSVTPLSPETVEQMRLWLLNRDRVRDATLVSVLAYAGLRPGEGLRADVGQRARAYAALSRRRSVSAPSPRRRHADAAACEPSPRWPRISPNGACAPVAHPTLRSCFPRTTASRGRRTTGRTGGGASSDPQPPPPAPPMLARTTCATRSCRC